MAYWLARDKGPNHNNVLVLYSKKPKRNPEGFEVDCNRCAVGNRMLHDCSVQCCLPLPASWHPEITYKNSPVKISGVVVKEPHAIFNGTLIEVTER